MVETFWQPVALDEKATPVRDVRKVLEIEVLLDIMNDVDSGVKVVASNPVERVLRQDPTPRLVVVEGSPDSRYSRSEKNVVISRFADVVEDSLAGPMITRMAAEVPWLPAPLLHTIFPQGPSVRHFFSNIRSERL